jgi:pyrroloquinoline quinone biosynthesis protein D
MSTATMSADARPRLARGVRFTHNEAHGGWVLLAPERIFQTDAIAVEILKRCTGEVSLAAVIDDLASTYAAPREQISRDVEALLASLAEKKLIEFDHA